MAGSLFGVAGKAAEVGRRDRRVLLDALCDAAGVPAVVSAVEGSVRRSGAARTGWPVLRWTAGLRADPLRRLHLSGPADERGRTSLAGASSASTARLATALRTVRDAAGEELPPSWRDSLRRELAAREASLPERLDRAVAGTELGAERTPPWWAGARAAQAGLLAVAALGALWLVALALLGALQLDSLLPLPRVGLVPVPPLLLLGGLLGGALLAVGSRPLVRRLARRRGRQARNRLRRSVEQVAETELLEPVEQVAAAHRRYREALERAAG